MIFLKLGRYFNKVPYSVISGINGVSIELEYYDKALETSSPGSHYMLGKRAAWLSSDISNCLAMWPTFHLRKFPAIQPFNYRLC